MRTSREKIRFCSLYRSLRKFHSISLLSEIDSITKQIRAILNNRSNEPKHGRYPNQKGILSNINVYVTHLKELIGWKKILKSHPGFDVKKNMQYQLNEFYFGCFGDVFFDVFEDVFGVNFFKAMGHVEHRDVNLLLPIVMHLSSDDFSVLKSQPIGGYNFQTSYIPGVENDFDFGFLKGHNVDEMSVIQIPFINYKNDELVMYLCSPQGVKIFSILKKVFTLGNHDNIIHNFFFLNELNKRGENELYGKRGDGYPYLFSEIGNIYEIWSIHAYRDFIDKLYKEVPGFKEYVLDLGVKFMDALMKISNLEVKQALLDSFAYFYGRIVDVHGSDFYEPSSYGDFVTQSSCYNPLLHILKENIKTLSNYERYLVLWRWIHNNENPKLIFQQESGVVIKVDTHQEVLRHFTPNFFD